MNPNLESGTQSKIQKTDLFPQNDEPYINYPQDVEKVNGRWAMLGFVALFGAYISTGQIIPGIL
tara:strand:- start:203 stop:394 length:192 start_codon:yes stop_codon:yes gene_type:complete